MIAPEWVADAVFYQIFPDRFAIGNRTITVGSRIDDLTPSRTVVPWDTAPSRTNFFGGDLAGITESLDYIREMGFNALYLNPIFLAGTNHRYDTFDYYRIDPMLGDDDAFDRLLREAHRRSMHVVLDGVFNHCGLGFAPFVDVQARGAESRYRNWFTIYDWPVVTGALPNYATCGGVDYLPRLNTANPEVEKFIHDVVRHWLGRGIDGWRLDVAYEIAPDFWRRFRLAVKKEYPEAYIVAEEWRDASPLVQGDTFDGAMHYELRGLGFDFIVTNALTGEAFGRAVESLLRRYPGESEYGMLTTLGTHDTPRLLTVCGEREDMAILLFAFLFTMPGAPMVYYGDETGMTGGDDPDCRRPMQWDTTLWRKPIADAIGTLIHLRTERPSLRRGTTEVVWANDRVVAVQRETAEETTLVILNNSHRRRTLRFPLPRNSTQRLCTDCLTGRKHTVDEELILPNTPPRSYFIFDIKDDPSSSASEKSQSRSGCS